MGEGRVVIMSGGPGGPGCSTLLIRAIIVMLNVYSTSGWRPPKRTVLIDVGMSTESK